MTRVSCSALLSSYGQEHLLAFWDKLDAAERESLVGQIEAIDFGLIWRLYESRDCQGDIAAQAARAEPPPAFRLGTGESISGGLSQFSFDENGTVPLRSATVIPSPVLDAAAGQNPFSPEQARRRAVESLRAGRFGVILVAGGQGSRLGFDRPKGMFPIGPVSKKSLFQIHAEKIVAASRRYNARIPLYVMTSPATHDKTAAYFAEHERFGLAEDDVFLFCQGTMPAVNAETGRVLLESPGRVAASPDGHGGMLAALTRTGALNDIERRGIRHLFYFQVDNPLVDICGQEFVGYHLSADSEFSTQVVAKRDPMERVGNVVRIDGRLMVIEYSDLPDDAARRCDADGSPVFWAGNIAVHIIDTSLLRRTADTADGLPFHVARKKVACLDPSGRLIEPARPNAIKFERFIFDLMPHARNAIVVEVDPAKAFAPLKNDSARRPTRRRACGRRLWRCTPIGFGRPARRWPTARRSRSARFWRSTRKNCEAKFRPACGSPSRRISAIRNLNLGRENQQ